MIRISVLALALSFCAANTTPAIAGSADESETISLSPREFPQFRAAVDRELRSGGELAAMGSKDRKELAGVLERMGTTLAQVENVDELNYDRRTDLFNDQEHLQALLDQARSDSRQVCERRRTVGSHVTRVVCLSVAERERRENASQNAWRVVTSRGANCGARGPATIGFDQTADCRPDSISDL